MIRVMFNRIGTRLIGTAIIASALAALLLVAACSGDESTPTASSGGDGAASQLPTGEALTPTPSPTPTAIPSPTFTPTPTPISFSVALPLPPTATPRPTATPGPTPTAKELDELKAVLESELPTLRMLHETVVLNDGRILFAGGELPTVANNGLIISEPHPLFEVYDPVAEDWSLAHLFDAALVFPRLLKLSNGDIFVHALDLSDVDADSDELPLPSAFLMDGETLAITPISPPLGARVSPDLILLDDGKVAAIGGIDVLSESSIFAVPVSHAVEIYDPAADVWIEGTPQIGELERSYNFWEQTNVSQWVFPLPGSKILTFRVGEVPRVENDPSDDVGLIELLDLSTGTWEPLATLKYDYSDSPWHSVVSEPDVLHIIHDERIESFNLSTKELSITYAFDNAIFRGGERNSSGRHAFSMNASVTELPDGRYLIAGGEGGNGSSLPGTTTTLYDPATGYWAWGPELAVSRSRHSATVLNDGSVLLFGGITLWEENESEGVPTGSMEIIQIQELARVDTVTPPAAVGLGNPWELCVEAMRLETLPQLATFNVNQAEPALNILTEAAKSVWEPSSYSMASASMRFNRDEPSMDSPSTNQHCNYFAYLFDDADSYQRDWLYLKHRNIDRHEQIVGIARTVYTRSLVSWWRDNPDWTVSEADAKGDGRELILATLDQEFINNLVDLKIDGVEQLNGVDVYRIHGKITYEGVHYGSTVTYWIGVEDNRVRQLLHKWDTAWNWVEGDDPIQYEYDLTEFSAFEEDFDIQTSTDSGGASASTGIRVAKVCGCQWTFSGSFRGG